jgi:replicative DNA helicase
MDKRHHQIEQISRGLKTLAKELNVCILLLSQLNRASEGGEPELQHLKESGSIEEDADVVLMLSPVSNEPDGTLLVLAKVAKNRGGKRGRLTLSFNGGTQTWVESSRSVALRSSGGAP